MGKRELIALLCLFVFLVTGDCCVAFPQDATGLSSVCDCGVSWSYLIFCGIPTHIVTHSALCAQEMLGIRRI